METKTNFGICDKVVYFNSAEQRFEEGIIMGVQVIPTALSKDEKGEDVVDNIAVLYKMKDGMVVNGKEVFGSKEEAVEFYRELFSRL